MGAAASSFPFRVGEQRRAGTRWTLYDGQRKSDNEDVSILVFTKNGAHPESLHSAKHYEKKLKTLRHPHILKFIDSLEVPESIYIVCERVSPLIISSDRANVDSKILPLGVYQVASAINFLNTDCKMSHCAVSPEAIFISKSGDWKLGGMDRICDASELAVSDWSRHSFYIPSMYASPDMSECTHVGFRNVPLHALDSWCFGCLIYEIYNGSLSRRDQLKNTGNIPNSLIPYYQRLLAKGSSNRITSGQLLSSKYFECDIIQTVEFLDHLALKNNAEKEVFFRGIQDKLGSLGDSLSRYRVLPCLVQALEYGSVADSAARVLNAMLHIGAKLSTEEFKLMVQPCLLKLFACNDRAIRAGLLKNVSEYIIHLSDTVVNDTVWPQVVTGFTDTEPRLREATIKSLLSFLPKLKDKTIQVSAYPMISRMQRDPVPGIRTNTVIALGKVAKFLSPTTQSKILLPSFSLALRDPFIPSRQSALAALQATCLLYSPEQIAKSVLHSVCQHLVDPSKQVRDQAFITVRALVDRVETATLSLPDQKQEENLTAAENSRSNSSVVPTDLAGASALAGKLTGWAVSSISKKLLDGGSSAERNSKNTIRTGTDNANWNPPVLPKEGPGPASTPRAAEANVSSFVSDDQDDLAPYSIPGDETDLNGHNINLEDDFFANPDLSTADDILSQFNLSVSTPSVPVSGNASGFDESFIDWMDNASKIPTIPLPNSSSLNPTAKTTLATPTRPILSSAKGAAPVKPVPQPLRPTGWGNVGKSNTQSTFNDDFFNNW
uniref:Protein kinase domain-containing protein n=1 Tax=Spongospora subterranea TaxID=70186 RepID=A0A0H5R7T5_9EUKA|eukprot:CRZ10198.1 hypothetical protein [Spongospora subterranea]